MKKWVLAIILVAMATAAMGQDITFKPYGFVKFETILDQNNTAKGDWLLFVPSGSDGNGVFTMNARHSRIGVKFGGPTFGADGKINALIEMDFAGGFPNSGTAARQPIPRLRHAWVELAKPSWSLRFGQDWGLISGPFPTTTSFVVGAGKGNLWMRFPQIKLTVGSGKVKAAVSVNRPIAGNVKYDDFAGGDFDVVGDGELSGRPWLMGRLWLDGKKGGMSVMGHVGWEKIVAADVSDQMTTSYSFAAEGRLTAGKISLTAKGFTGKNLNSFLGGIFQGYRIDENNKILGLRSVGGWGQIKVPLTDICSATAGYGTEMMNEDDLIQPESDSADMRKANSIFWFNVARKVGKHVTFMVEAEHLTTQYVKGADGTNWRQMFVTLFNF